MMSFPLLKLPYLAIQKVVLHLTFNEIVEFSFCSSKCKRLMRSMKHSYTSISVLVLKGWQKIVLNIGKGHGHVWNFRLKPLKRGVKPDGNELRIINGRAIRVQKDHKWSYLNSCTTPITQMKVVYDYLQELFNNLPVESAHFSSFHEALSPRKFGIRSCGSLALYDRKKKIPVDHIRYFLEDIKVSTFLDIHLPNNLDFRLDTARFSADEVYIEYAQWVSRDTFLSMDCTRITLWNECFPQKDIQDFISQWLNSTNTRLVWLKMIPSERRTYFDSSMFPTKPWNPNSRGRYFKLEHCDDYNGISKVDCSEGMDLIRSDGLMASLVFKAYTTYFLVWHDRHHDGMENYPDDYFYW